LCEELTSSSEVWRVQRREGGGTLSLGHRLFKDDDMRGLGARAEAAGGRSGGYLLCPQRYCFVSTGLYVEVEMGGQIF